MRQSRGLQANSRRQGATIMADHTTAFLSNKALRIAVSSSKSNAITAPKPHQNQQLPNTKYDVCHVLSARYRQKPRPPTPPSALLSPFLRLSTVQFAPQLLFRPFEVPLTRK